MAEAIVFGGFAPALAKCATLDSEIVPEQGFRAWHVGCNAGDMNPGE
jgi:hypothetical protein